MAFSQNKHNQHTTTPVASKQASIEKQKVKKRFKKITPQRNARNRTAAAATERVRVVAAAVHLFSVGPSRHISLHVGGTLGCLGLTTSSQKWQPVVCKHVAQSSLVQQSSVTHSFFPDAAVVPAEVAADVELS